MIFRALRARSPCFKRKGIARLSKNNPRWLQQGLSWCTPKATSCCSTIRGRHEGLIIRRGIALLAIGHFCLSFHADDLEKIIG